MSFRSTVQPVAIAAVAALFTLMSAAPDQSLEPTTIHRRDLVTLCRAMEAYTDRTCVKYINYGCFCGLGGYGNTPKDAVDTCCFKHDQCYGSVKGCDVAVHVVINKITCSGGNCTCTDKDQTSCAYKLCRCDVVFAECLKGAAFNESLSNYNKKNCT